MWPPFVKALTTSEIGLTLEMREGFIIELIVDAESSSTHVSGIMLGTCIIDTVDPGCGRSDDLFGQKVITCPGLPQCQQVTFGLITPLVPATMSDELLSCTCAKVAALDGGADDVVVVGVLGVLVLLLFDVITLVLLVLF